MSPPSAFWPCWRTTAAMPPTAPRRELAQEPIHVTVVGAKADAAARQLRRAALAYPAVTLRAEWWDRAGFEDPLDRVIETYWGAHTLLEALERETWHAAQHARQVMMFLEQLGIAADRPLTGEDLAGLPLPEQVWD